MTEFTIQVAEPLRPRCLRCGCLAKVGHGTLKYNDGGARGEMDISGIAVCGSAICGQVSLSTTDAQAKNHPDWMYGRSPVVLVNGPSFMG